MATIDQIGEALKNAHASGDTEAASKLAHAYKDMQSQPTPDFKRPERSYDWTEVPEQFVKNLPSTGGKVLEGIANMVVHPIDTASQTLQLAGGELGKVLPESVNKVLNKYDPNPEATQKGEEMAGAVNAQYAKDYGSIEGIKRKLAEDPAGFLMDLSTIASGGGALAAKVPALAKPAVIASKIGTYTNPLEMGLNLGGKVLTNTYDILSGAKPRVNAGKIARGALGATLEPTLAMLKNAPQDLTAAQAAYGTASPLFATLGEMGDVTNGVPYLNKRNAAIDSLISSIKENTPSLSESQAIRKAAKDISYPIAEAQKTPVSPEILGLMERMPTSVVNTTEGLNKYDIGNPEIVKPNFSFVTGNQPYISGASAINIGKALKDMITAPKTENKGGATNIALGNLRDKFLTAMETASPELGAARKEYAQLSAPVNQSEIMSRYLDILNPSRGQYNLSGFRTSLGEAGQEALLKDVLGSKTKGDLAKHLLPNQSEALINVENQLIRDEVLAQQGAAGKGALKKIWDENTFMQKLPSYLNATTSTANKALDIVERKVAGATERAISKGMESPENAIEMLNMLPADERVALIKGLRKSATPFSKTAPVIGYETNQNKD
jgi:hypothetical protein